MPELPEVETICRDLNKTVLLKTITGVKVNDPYIIKGLTAQAFTRQLIQAQVVAIYRRGKALVLSLSNNLHWVVQPMMTGQLVYFYPKESPRIVKETRLVINLSDKGVLIYNDQRRFGHLRLVKDVLSINYFKIIGPEPLTDSFHAGYLASALLKTKRPIKNVLLDHTVVAGIGNIYASEILFKSGINPERPADAIQPREIRLLYRHTVGILNKAIELRGSSMRNYRDGRGQKGEFNKVIQVYARAGEPCLKCEQPIKRIFQSGRSSFFCPMCQQ